MFHYVPMIFPINCWLCSHLWILLMVILPMIFSWYSIPMVSLWFSMTPPWFANDISIIFPCFFNDIPMFFPMICPWFSHNISMICPWFSLTVSMIFHYKCCLLPPFFSPAAPLEVSLDIAGWKDVGDGFCVDSQDQEPLGIREGLERRFYGFYPLVMSK